MHRQLSATLTTLALAGTLLLGGCAETASGVTKGLLDKLFEPEPSSIDARLQASDDVNPDVRGRPSPVVVRFYELKSLSVFNNADFFTLYDQDVALLGEELLVRNEFRLHPGESKEIKRQLNPDTRFIGVIAAYRDIGNASWRKTTAIELNDETTFVVEFGAEAVAIKKTK